MSLYFILIDLKVIVNQNRKKQQINKSKEMLLTRRIASIGADLLARRNGISPIGGGRKLLASSSTTDDDHKHFLQYVPDLKSGDSGEVDWNALDRKILLLYFSAGWCHTCQDFTPKLKKFYASNKDNVAVLWVSRDKSKEEQQQYYAKSLDSSWLYVPLGPTVRHFLKLYKLHGLPSVKMVDREGNLMEEELKKDIEEGNPNELVQKWRKQLNIQ